MCTKMQEINWLHWEESYLRNGAYDSSHSTDLPAFLRK
jgi:hypothetical protein